MVPPIQMGVSPSRWRIPFYVAVSEASNPWSVYFRSSKIAKEQASSILSRQRRPVRATSEHLDFRLTVFFVLFFRLVGVRNVEDAIRERGLNGMCIGHFYGMTDYVTNRPAAHPKNTPHDFTQAEVLICRTVDSLLTFGLSLSKVIWWTSLLAHDEVPTHQLISLVERVVLQGSDRTTTTPRRSVTFQALSQNDFILRSLGSLYVAVLEPIQDVARFQDPITTSSASSLDWPRVLIAG